MATWITICDTCKRPEWDVQDSEQTDGEALARLIEEICASEPDLNTRRVSCLMGCKQGCNITLQDDGKLAYTLGRFEPNKEYAKAIVDYARLYKDSASGQVPFRDWPEAIKGHFITRHHPLPKS